MKRRTIHYFRARCVPPGRMTFEQAVLACLGPSPEAVVETDWPERGASAAVLNFERAFGSLRLHIGMWITGEEASMVTRKPQGDQMDQSTQPPPPDSDYLNGDGMVLVSEDHCLVMPSRTRTDLVTRFLERLIALGVEQVPTQERVRGVGFSKIVRGKVADQIRREGVSSVHLNLSQYKETTLAKADEAPKSSWSSLTSAILDQFKGPLTREQMAQAANLDVELSIRVDKRFKRHGALQPRDLSHLGDQVASEVGFPSDVVIETGSGQRIRHGELALTKPVELPAFGQSVRHEDAWEAMAGYFKELKASGSLEE